ncbi:MAG TPA: class I SAM-dependent methyltransferase [Candidatus Binatia bacterium]|nr:class I SAM-dependent methyltransferase [Candidatus Binatia bacterium]
MKCETCGVYFLPGVSEQEIAEYYASGKYRSSNQQRDETAHQRRRAANIVRYLKSPKVFLDVGCSAGILMDVVREQFGAECYGVDPDPVLAHNVYKDIKDAPILADCVTLIHSLEHMPHPLDALKDVYSKMSPGGQIVIEVPNGDLENPPCYLGVFKFPHVVMFSMPALHWTMERAGFCVENTVIHGDGGLVKAGKFYYLLVSGRKLAEL